MWALLLTGTFLGRVGTVPSKGVGRGGKCWWVEEQLERKEGSQERGCKTKGISGRREWSMTEED